MSREQFPVELLPSAIKQYVQVGQRCTESPDEFLAAGALYCASVLSGKWVRFGSQALNNYLLLVGPTGTAKKTSAQSLATQLLNQIKAEMPQLQYKTANPSDEKNPILGPTSAYPVVTNFSVEGLQSHAVGKGTSTGITLGEYTTMFEVSKRQGQQNTISELTNMYDGNPIHVRTLNRQSDAENYCISIIGASTASWCRDFLAPRNVSGGFVNRHLVIMGEPTRILPNPSRPEGNDWSDVVEKFCSLVPDGLRGELHENRVVWTGPSKQLHWNSDAELAWDGYYRQRTTVLRQLSEQQPLLAELSARELTHVVKLAGLRAFLEGRTMVMFDDLLFGARFSRWSIRNVVDLVATEERVPSGGNHARKIVEKLKKYGPMSKTDLARSFGGNQEFYNSALQHLLIDKRVVQSADGILRLSQDCLSNSMTTYIERFFGPVILNVPERATPKQEHGDVLRGNTPIPHAEVSLSLFPTSEVCADGPWGVK